MKRTITTIALVCAASAFTALAQDKDATTTAPAGPKHEGRPHHGGGPMREALEALTPAEREQLKAAHQKAESDPAMAAAKESMKAAHEAMKAALLRADPTIGPILEKMEAARKEQREERKERKEHHKPAPTQ
ncbi:MAG: hypothetical protein WCI40_01120 [Verrucomicrobiota bacterium]